MVDETAAGAPPLLERLAVLCRTALPDSTVLVHGSLALGDYTPGKSDLDILVLSDTATDELVEAVETEWNDHPTNLDLRLYFGVHDRQWEVERYIDEPDLVVEFSVCRQLGHTELIGPVPDEWVDEVGAVVLGRWKEIGDDPPHHELMALTACRIWRFREERLHCSKPAAAEWARRHGAQVAFDGDSVRALLDLATG